MIDSEVERKKSRKLPPLYRHKVFHEIQNTSRLLLYAAGSGLGVLRIAYRVFRIAVFIDVKRQNCGDALGCCSNQPIKILGLPVADTPGKGSIPRPECVG
jgi:hypothetical protein